MINLGSDYDKIPTWQEGTFPKLPAGGYVCIVKKVSVEDNKNNKPMLVLEIDILEGEFKGFFKNSQYPPKIFRNIFDKDNKISPFFKGLLANFGDSNGFSVVGGMFDEKILLNKSIGVVFADEEYESNGIVKVRASPSFTTTVEIIRNGEFKVPQLKKLQKSKPVEIDDIDSAIPDESVPF